MSECDDAKADLDRAEDRLSAAADWVSSATSAVDSAEGAHGEAKYAHRRAISAAEGFDTASNEAAAEVTRAEAKLSEYERNYDGSNREVLLADLREKVRQAEFESRIAKDRSKDAWADVAARALDEEHALTAVTTAKNKLSLAEEDQAKAEAWVNEAKKAVASACS